MEKHTINKETENKVRNDDTTRITYSMIQHKVGRGGSLWGGGLVDSTPFV